jgi:hypothetical protein
MSAIISRAIEGSANKLFRLDNNEILRKMEIGDNWEKLAIGVNLRMQYGTVEIFSTPRFHIGVCSGTGNPVGHSETILACGVMTTGATFWRSGYVYRVTLAPFCKVGSSKTFGTDYVFNPGQYGLITSYPTGATQWMIVITRGNPNFTFEFLIAGSVGSAGSIPIDEVMRALDTLSLGYVESNWTHMSTSPVTVAVDDSDDPLDSITIGWDRTADPIEIADLVFARWA